MRGRVLSFNGTTGLISGDDGKRYSFDRADLMDASHVVPGTKVDFEIEGMQARGVYVVPGILEEKNKWIAVVLACPFAFGLGMFGLHKFYLGRIYAGIWMALGTLLVITAPIVFFISFIETIIYLVKSEQSFYEDYVVGKKSWF